MEIKQYIFSAVAYARLSTEIVTTVGIVTGCNVAEVEEKALSFAKERWPPLVGWSKYSVSVMEVDPTSAVEREDEETTGGGHLFI